MCPDPLQFLSFPEWSGLFYDLRNYFLENSNLTPEHIVSTTTSWNLNRLYQRLSVIIIFSPSNGFTTLRWLKTYGSCSGIESCGRTVTHSVIASFARCEHLALRSAHILGYEVCFNLNLTNEDFQEAPNDHRWRGPFPCIGCRSWKNLKLYPFLSFSFIFFFSSFMLPSFFFIPFINM